MSATHSHKLAYSLREASEVTSLSRSTLYNLAKDGKLSIRKVAGRSIILRDDIMTLIGQ